jgi:DNA mismatch endonuclease (patch repair protein)
MVESHQFVAMDNVEPETRGRMMRAVRGKNTKPELAVRAMAHAMGFRFRLHRPDLPGTPDIVFPSLQSVILVHGCFWHRHRGCPATTTPKANFDFWSAKFMRNVERDRACIKALRKQGWRVLVVWECQARDSVRLQYRLRCFLAKTDRGPRRDARGIPTRTHDRKARRAPLKQSRQRRR